MMCLLLKSYPCGSCDNPSCLLIHCVLLLGACTLYVYLDSLLSLHVQVQAKLIHSVNE
jgi:hypothetical protein